MAHFLCCKDWYLVGNHMKIMKQFEKVSNFCSQHIIQKVVGERALNHAQKRYKFIRLEGNKTNLVQTSWAMLGLMLGGQSERDPTPLHKATKLLINSHMDYGDFPQQEIMGVHMKNCMLHYPEYRNTFPL
ncbi:putative terpenoid cyclases/protein prenyltransferase alpha-alpha toroid [Helianthus debilis subsp. tardiflorus]